MRDTLTLSVIVPVSPQMPWAETVKPVITSILPDRITPSHHLGMMVEMDLSMQGLVTMGDMQAIIGNIPIVQVIGMCHSHMTLKHFSADMARC